MVRVKSPASLMIRLSPGRCGLSAMEKGWSKIGARRAPSVIQMNWPA